MCPTSFSTSILMPGGTDLMVGMMPGGTDLMIGMMPGATDLMVGRVTSPCAESIISKGRYTVCPKKLVRHKYTCCADTE